MYPQQATIELIEALQREYKEAKTRCICLKPFDDCQNNRKVRDHCHYTAHALNLTTTERGFLQQVEQERFYHDQL